jgi:asparagine synthase (glutamine-hydrolysing)
MCGIAGYFGTGDVSNERVSACVALMGRRGPDHAGVWRARTESGRHVVLLHSRLSIIDLDPRANQPFRDGGMAFVINGELYNYLELRLELEREGCAFATQSDTEVFLKLLARRGLAALTQCEGMWAWALFDQATGALTLCRDRFGEKPLYLFRDDGGIYFASEIKFLRALVDRPFQVNYQHLYRYLVNGYKALYKVTDTFFSGVEELPASSFLNIDAAGNAAIQKYWVPKFIQDDEMTYAQAVAGARQALIDSVEQRLRADVPLAFCMSGGVDSNALISIAKNIFSFDVHGFTVVNTDARYEEQDMVDCAVRELGIRHTAVPIGTDGFLEKLRVLVRQHDAPVYTITYYVHWLLMQSIQQHGYRISISGTAADELFSGYYDHHNAYLYAVRRDPERYRHSLENWTRHIKPIVRNPYLADPEVFIKDPGLRDHIYLDAPKFAEYLVHPWIEPFAEKTYTDDLLRNRMANELFEEAVPVILHEDDLNAMYYSIENRSPYLDTRLFEFSAKIPTRHLVRDGMAKAVLRDAMRGIVPDPILDNRRKVGFNAPLLELLDMSNPAVRAYVLGEGAVYNLVKRSAVERLLERKSLPNSLSKFLFNFVCVKVFLDEFGEGIDENVFSRSSAVR